MLTLHPTDKHEVVHTEDQEAIAEAARAARALRGIGADCSVAAMLMLAAQRFPDDGLALAAKKLTAEFEVFRSQIKPIAAEAEAKKKAENERLSQWTGPVMNRLGEIRQRIEWIHRCISENTLRESKPDSRVADLRRKGVSEAEITRICGAYETTEALLAQKAVLVAEQEKLHLFQKTGDTTLLPTHIGPYKRNPAPAPVLDSDVKAMVETLVVG